MRSLLLDAAVVAVSSGQRERVGVATQGVGRVVVATQPGAAVLAHVVDDRQQRAALLGQRVLDAWRDLGEGLPLDDRLLLERAQAQRQRARADAGELTFELTEARRAGGELAHEQQGPLTAHDICRPTHRTCLSYGHFPLLYQMK